MGMSKTTLARVISVLKSPLSDQVRAILNKYGATMLLPGVSGAMRFGYQPGNYRESTGQTLAAADQQVGLVVDAARVPGPELVGSAWVNASAAPATATFSSGVLTLNATGGTSRCRTSIPTVAGRTYRVTARKLNAGSDCTLDVGTSAGDSQISVNNTVGTAGVSFTFVATTTQTWLNFYRGATSVTEVTDISVRELPGIHASQSTSGFQPVLRNASGIQSWQFDGTDDRFTMAFPTGAGWSDATIITARSTGAVTEAGQNVEGTHLFQVSGNVYGRIYIPASLSAGEFATLQKFANVLSGYSA